LDRALSLGPRGSRRAQAHTLTIDGELVVTGKGGIANFEKLHSRTSDAAAILYA
jgi:ATP-dependent DNA ligase